MYAVLLERVISTVCPPVPGASMNQTDVVPDSPAVLAAVAARIIATPPHVTPLVSSTAPPEMTTTPYALLDVVGEVQLRVPVPEARLVNPPFVTAIGFPLYGGLE
jgi:hypothetical protein